MDGRYREFLENPQPPVKLRNALEGYFSDPDPAHHQAYGDYLRRRLRPAMEKLIAEDAADRIEILLAQDWVDATQMEQFLLTARQMKKPAAMACLLQEKANRFGFRDRDFSL